VPNFHIPQDMGLAHFHNPSYSQFTLWFLASQAQGEDGNPVRIRNCPAAVSRNERPIGTGLKQSREAGQVGSLQVRRPATETFAYASEGR